MHTFAFYKDINRTGAQRWKRSKITLASEKRKFVLVMVMDPQSTPRVGRGRTTVLYSFRLCIASVARLTAESDINIFEEETRGANGDTTVSLVCALYQCFIEPAPLLGQGGLSVFHVRS